MTEKEYAQVIAKNLKRIAYERDKTQTQIAQELKIHRATLSAWMNGTRTPKIWSVTTAKRIDDSIQKPRKT